MQAIKDEINQFQIKNPQKLPSVVFSKMFDLYQNMKDMKNIKDTLESSQEQEQEKNKQNKTKAPTQQIPKILLHLKITFLKCICLRELME